MSFSIPTKRIALSFLAHPDDAEILCAGTLIRLADQGWDIHIATATAGDCGSAKLSPEEISEIRICEAKQAAAVIGATYHCLKLKDVNVVFDQASNRLAIDLFRQISPTVVFTHPRHDYMLDHEQVHLLARSAAFSAPIPNASELPLTDDAAIPWLYYCDPLEGIDPYNGLLVNPSIYVNIDRQMAQKTDMLVCHESQREWLRSHHGMDEYVDAMMRHGAKRGSEFRCQYAEAFTQHRGHAFPQSDLLQELFS